jgi:hypothetical protein
LVRAAFLDYFGSTVDRRRLSTGAYFRFGKRKGSWTHTLTPVGRAYFIILGVACIFAGITGITEFVGFR